MATFSLVEIWRPRPGWHELTQAHKHEFHLRAQAVLQTMFDKGAKLLGIHRCRALSEGGWDVFAYWQMPSMDLVIELSERLERLGWNVYFDQVNYVGKTITAEEYTESLLSGVEAIQ
jgi:hypothetical protein